MSRVCFALFASLLLPTTAQAATLIEVAHISMGQLASPGSPTLLSGMWKWTSANGERYIFVGTTDGLYILRVTDPKSPEALGRVVAMVQHWSDVAIFDKKTDDGFSGYAYLTTETPADGVHILALDGLDDLGPAASLQQPIPTSVFKEGGYAGAKKIHVNPDTGYAYLSGVHLDGPQTACDGHPQHPAPHNTLVLDLLANPQAPTVAACQADTGPGNIHAVAYDGPDPDYQGREIAFHFGPTTRIWDVTEKGSEELISAFTKPGPCYTARGWTQVEGHPFLILDEGPEWPHDDWTPGSWTPHCAPGGPPRARLQVVDVSDLDNPVLHDQHEIAIPGGTPHTFSNTGMGLFSSARGHAPRLLQAVERDGTVEFQSAAHLDVHPSVHAGTDGLIAFPEAGLVVAADRSAGLTFLQEDLTTD